MLIVRLHLEKKGGEPCEGGSFGGRLAQLSAMGLPLAVAVQLQQSNLKLEGALWTAKCSGSGFSVSLFWPSSASPVSVPAKRRRRRKRKKSKVGGSGGGKQLAEKQSGSEQPLQLMLTVVMELIMRMNL